MGARADNWDSGDDESYMIHTLSSRRRRRQEHVHRPIRHRTRRQLNKFACLKCQLKKTKVRETNFARAPSTLPVFRFLFPRQMHRFRQALTQANTPSATAPAPYAPLVSNAMTKNANIPSGRAQSPATLT